MIVDHMSETIGNTPLLRLTSGRNGAAVFLKLEMFNPTGSMKDRMALSMVNRLEDQCANDPRGMKIVESSSGNTASALSMLCASRGYQFTAVMDHHASRDKVLTVEALGGKVKFVDAGDGKLATAMRDSEAERLSETDPDTFWTAQHDNPANSDGYDSLASELVSDLGNDIYAFVSAIGTGGSLCGTAKALKNTSPGIKVVGVEPFGSIIFGGEGHDYHQSGTGTPAGASVGLVIDYDVIDIGKKVSDTHAFSTCRYLATKFGILVGGSTGGAVYEALQMARNAPPGAKIVTLACDNGSKYLDSIFDDDWLQARNLHLSKFESDLLQ